jgi:hypothetical protein
MLYTCNHTGLHDPVYAASFGVAVYDWSNAKSEWVNTHPMNCEEMLTKQAEMVLAEDPGIPTHACTRVHTCMRMTEKYSWHVAGVEGGQPRVWVYRNTIKALNWFSSVREKLDDPQYSGWFVKLKDYAGPSSNSSYHVPACDWCESESHLLTS